jgi:hypothetical protein
VTCHHLVAHFAIERYAVRVGDVDRNLNDVMWPQSLIRQDGQHIVPGLHVLTAFAVGQVAVYINTPTCPETKTRSDPALVREA